MTTNDKLNPTSIRSQCSTIISEVSNDLNVLLNNKNEIDSFVNDTEIESISFDQLKIQFDCYNPILDLMIDANNKLKDDCDTLQNSVGDEVLDGSVIIPNKNKYKKLAADMFAKGAHYATLAAVAVIPSLVALFSSLATFYNGLAAIYYALYLYWYGKEKKFDSIEASTCSLFDGINTLITEIIDTLNELINSYVLGQGYQPAVNSQTTVDEEDEIDVDLDTDNVIEFNAENIDTSSWKQADIDLLGRVSGFTGLTYYAVSHVSCPYASGGMSYETGIDCSGFVDDVYAQYGISVPRNTSDINALGNTDPANWTYVSLEDAVPGDIICFSGHVTIYLGDGIIVHASNPADYYGTPQANGTTRYGGIKMNDLNYYPDPILNIVHYTGEVDID